ncbi:hypothetical protein MRX96_038709 [Rhipicephalus microplus]
MFPWLSYQRVCKAMSTSMGMICCNKPFGNVDQPVVDAKTTHVPSLLTADVDVRATDGAKDATSPYGPSSPQPGSATTALGDDSGRQQPAGTQRSRRRKSKRRKGVGKTERRKKKAASREEENREQPDSLLSKGESRAAVANGSQEKD